MNKTMEEEIISEIEEVERGMKDAYADGGLSSSQYTKFSELMKNLRVLLGVEIK